MSKSIDTLVEDIYGLFSSDFSPSKEAVSDFGKKLSEHLATRIAENRGKPTLRLSSIGTPCDRKLWYSINTPDQSEPLSPATRIKFLFGDIIEELLLFLAEQAGHEVVGQQDELSIAGVKGHRDAVIDGVVTDCKSASSIAFRKFKEGRIEEDDPFGYIDQINAYVYGSKDDEAVREGDIGAFLVVDKQLGNICLHKQPINGKDYEEVVKEKQAIVSSETPPERAFEPVPEGKAGNLKLPTVCSYCSFKQTCWPNLRTFLYSKGPVYLTHVEKQPNVIEVDSEGRVVETGTEL